MKLTNEQILKFICEYAYRNVQLKCFSPHINETRVGKIESIDLKQQSIILEKHPLIFYVGDDDIKIILKQLPQNEIENVINVQSKRKYVESLMLQNYDIPRSEFYMRTLHDVGLAIYE